MKVEAIRHDPSKFAHEPQSIDWGGGPDQLLEFLPRADFVVVMVPLTEATQGLVGAAELAVMKSSAHIINVARGPIIDQWALYHALSAGGIAGAALDVWYTYPRDGSVGVPSDAPLWGLPNVIATPHIAGITADVVRGELERSVQTLVASSEVSPSRIWWYREWNPDLSI